MNTNSFDKKNALITGGLGFIGSNLATRLVESGANVTLVDSLIPEYGGNLYNIEHIRDAVKINISDVRDVFSLQYLIKEQDYVFNLAGQTSHMDSMRDPYTDLDINCKAQLSILETCRLHNPSAKVIFASTRQIYGKPDYLPVDEKHPMRPVDVNGINKMAGEWYHILYHNVYDIATCVLRLTNTYGPRMRVKDARQTFLGIWIKQAVLGGSFEVWGGEQIRDYNYVDDVVDALLLAASSEAANGKIFNLGDEKKYTLLETAEVIKKASPNASFTVKDYPADRKRIDIGNYYASYTHINNTLGWLPRTPLETGIARSVEFYKKHLTHYQ